MEARATPACYKQAMSHAILTPQEMVAAERRVIDAGTNSFELMQRAGRAVAGHLQAQFPEGIVRVLCGPGGNGGDGFVAARHLSEHGRQVEVYLLGEPEALKGDAARACAAWHGAVKPLEAACGSEAGITLDALFGGGLSRALEGAPARLSEEEGPVVSVDVPSGLDGLTGRPLGAVFQADLTVTFAALRPGHVLVPGRALCGEVAVAGIGVPVDGTVRHNAPALWSGALPRPGLEGHKHARGYLLVLSGGPAETGAARLAARAGLRAGAGLVRLAVPPSALIVVASQITAEMATPLREPGDFEALCEEADAVVIGPAAGVTDQTRARVLAALGASAGAVIDADGLTVFQDDPSELFDALREGDVLTPHPGEFRRLFDGVLEASANRIEAARQAADMAGCTVLLKGSDTVIAAPDGRAVVNTHATPWLATAGTGDVLAGIIGAQMCQGMAGFAAACAGAWLHGDAGRRFGPGLIATDLPDMLPAVLAGLDAGEA